MTEKTLYLLRHAEAVSPSAALDDFDRPLNAGGQRAACGMGAYLAKKGWRPDCVLCSPARRAVETWEGLRAALGDLPVRYRKTLYLAPPSQVKACLHGLPARVRSVLVIGHNPGFAHFARRLVKGGKPQALQRLGGTYAPASLAVIRFPVPAWKAIEAGQGDLAAFLRPADF